MEVELNAITTSGVMSLLYEAAYSGDVSKLNSLLQQCPHILHKTSQTTFNETPLHVSCLRGHPEFTKQLLTLKPNLALEVDSSRMTALHMASAEGHIDTVKELLRVNSEPCLFPDEEGRIPLHYAVMRGRKEVVEELIKAKPESLIFQCKGKSVFHLCVTYNHLQTLIALVESESAINNGEFLSFTSCDDAGNTVLHLSIMLKRVEVVSYLLTVPEIREIANVENNIGFTAQDMLEQSPKDFKSCEIQHMLTMAEREGFEFDHPHPTPVTSTDDVVPPHPPPQISKMKRVRNFLIKFLRWIGKWSKREEEWLKEMRGNLSLVSTVIATISFQALINPPGGFIQQGLSSQEDTTASSNDPLSCTMLNDTEYCPGEALVSSPDLLPDYKKHLVYVTISFFSSLSITALLLICGIFPLKNRAVIWMLSIGMYITLTSLAAAYITAINIIIPTHLLEKGLIPKMKEVAFIKVWGKLLEIIVLLITLRFFIWEVKKCVMIFKKSRSWWRENRRRKFRLVLFRMTVIFVMLLLFFAQSFIVYLVFLIWG